MYVYIYIYICAGPTPPTATLPAMWENFERRLKSRFIKGGCSGTGCSGVDYIIGCFII